MKKATDKPTIIAIVGASGSGKTTLSLFLEKEIGIKSICSYTTRPMREREEQGREHWFVKEFTTPPSEIMAYTFFGGYHYWTEKSQLENQTTCSYVIDEKGLKGLKAKSGEDYNVVGVYVRRYDMTGIDPNRVKRDEERELLDHDDYDIILTNIGTLDSFLCNSLSSIKWYLINSAKSNGNK